MKLPDVFSGFLPKKEETKDYFFSLYLDVDAAAVAVWHIDPSGAPKVESFAHAVIANDTWEARIQVVDRLLSAAEEKVGVAKPITKTVFGIAGSYLTPDGNITESVRPHLKKLSKMLELTPVGFVPLFQAIAFSIKREEGVPTSAVLLGCSGKTARMSLFRVGQLTHDFMMVFGEDPASALESELKKMQDGDVLPSRILLYGGNAQLLEEARAKLLKHPWPSRANFLHFPKIEVISVEDLLTSVSLAGASELASEIGESADTADAGEEVSVVAQAPAVAHTDSETDETATADDITAEADEEEEAEEVSDEDTEEDEETQETEGEEEEEETHEAVADMQGVSIGDNDGQDTMPGNAVATDESVSVDADREELANVTMVTPESLGFRHEDVLEKPSAPVSAGHTPRGSSAKKLSFAALSGGMPKFSLGDTKSVLTGMLSRLFRGKGKALPIAGGIVVVGIILFALYYTVPKSTITVLVASQSLDESTVVSVDPKATVADPESKTIPGKNQEQSVTGEKTIAVTGKKNIGDPAKGTVTIYNKVTSGRSFPKGTTLTSQGVAFTLDSDVSVASASETIGSITFGKAIANVTAKEIGPNGNLAASSEFSFANVSPTSISARNESAFTGGTSKQVTVVSRADQDALVSAITEELVGQAKEQLRSTGEAGDRLIDATIKTEVAEKVFDAELNQEATQLHGKITVKVSGISIGDSDVKAALLPLVTAKIPSGYRLAPEQTNVTTSNVTVKKDGTITLTAKLTAVALPEINTEALRAQLVGKPVNEATAILRQTQGVAGAEYRFTLSPSHSRLPMSRNNITITVMVQ